MFLLSSYRFVYNIKNIDFLRKIPEFIEHFIVIVVVGVDVNVVGMLGVVVVVGVMLCLCEHSECNSLSTIQARAAHWPS